MGNASASHSRRGSYWLSGIVERELLIPLLVGDEMFIVEPIEAWVAPKVVVGVIPALGLGGFEGLPLEEWVRLSDTLLSWIVAFAGFFNYWFSYFFRKVVQSSSLAFDAGQEVASKFELTQCTVIKGFRYQAKPRVSRGVSFVSQSV